MPCRKTSHQPESKLISHAPVQDRLSRKKKSLLRGAYSLNCLDDISVDNRCIDKMDRSYDYDAKVFDEHTIAIDQ